MRYNLNNTRNVIKENKNYMIKENVIWQLLSYIFEVLLRV